MLLNSKLNHIDYRSASVNMTLLFNSTPCQPQHKSIIVYYCTFDIETYVTLRKRCPHLAIIIKEYVLVLYYIQLDP